MNYLIMKMLVIYRDKKLFKMKKSYILISYCLIIVFISMMTQACNERMGEDVPTSSMSLLQINDRTGNPLGMPFNYYMFKEDKLYKMGRGLTSPFRLSAPQGTRMFFFAGEAEPASLLAVEIGKTTLDEFLEIRTENHESPVRFYTGSMERTESSSYSIPLSIGEARIDLDATSSDLLRIKNVRIENGAATTLLFPQGKLSGSASKVEQTQEFNPPVEGRKENIFRIYESDTTVIFNVKGEYDGIPVEFKASLPQVIRNTKYTLKVLKAGAQMTGFFSVDQWQQTDTINTGTHADEKLLIDTEHSVFPEGTEVSESRQSLSVPYTGGEVILAFKAESMVDFESIIDELSNLQTDLIDTKREDDKILTRYRIRVAGQGENTLPYTTILNVKSVLRQHSTSIVSLIVGAPPLYIREVTLGGVTWMAFNARSRNPEDQIYPMKGYDVENMYNHEWLNTLGGMFQYGRNYLYVPWESGVNNQGNQIGNIPWTEAEKTPCPQGYRIPAGNELFKLFGNGISKVPGSWDYNGETITASEVTATDNQININGVIGVAKYLKLAGSRGGCMYIPYGGFKSVISPSLKDPIFKRGFRLWCSESDDEGKASIIDYQKFVEIDTDVKFIHLDKTEQEAYCYVRCIKE